MGTFFSGLSKDDQKTAKVPSKPGLGEVSESCVALILSHLEPQEICLSAGLNRAFHRASSADFVWESKLPENYQILVKKLLSNTERAQIDLNKKDIYAMLCRHNRFDGGTKEIWLEKDKGGLCVCISWKGLKITGIDDRRYWTRISTHESRFHTIAYLQQIWWLEVEGELDLEFPAGTYSLFFRLQLGTKHDHRRAKNPNPKQVHGWNIKPVRFQLSTSNAQHAISHCYLTEQGKWLHYHAGDFFVENSYIPTKIKFSMAQIDCTHTKGGLCLDYVLICPTELGDRFKHS